MDSILIKIDSIFGVFVGYIAEVLFYKGFPFFGFPFIVLVLLVGALSFTFYFRFINIRGFSHSIDIIKWR